MGGPKGVEVEVKLRLGGAGDHAKLAELLRPGYRERIEQENNFFDGSRGELSSRRVNLRVRLMGDRAEVTVKGKAVLVDGVSKASEENEAVGFDVARGWVADPATLPGAGPSLPGRTAEELGVPEGGFVGLGGFRNIRDVFVWEGETLELDETLYEWGTLYELECETERPEVVKPRLEALLRGAGVDFRDSTTSKFSNFRNRTLN